MGRGRWSTPIQACGSGVLVLLLAAWGIPTGVRAAPAAPVLVSPASNAVNVGTSPVLQVNVSDPGGGSLTVRFYGRMASPGPDFTIAVLPDSQYYCASARRGLPAMFDAQADWIVTNRLAWNIAYVAHLGDIVDDGATPLPSGEMPPTPCTGSKTR